MSLFHLPMQNLTENSVGPLCKNKVRSSQICGALDFFQKPDKERCLSCVRMYEKKKEQAQKEVTA